MQFLIKEFPNREHDIKELWMLCLSEIEQGESVYNEIEHLGYSLDEIEQEEMLNRDTKGAKIDGYGNRYYE